MAKGGCHCGAIRYEIDGTAQHTALCHCTDCQKSSGAPMVGWTAFAAADLTVSAGMVAEYESSEYGRRQFCGKCGTGLFYYNEMALPGIVDIQTATFDNPNDFPADVHIQTAERLDWMENAHQLPMFNRFPGPD